MLRKNVASQVIGFVAINVSTGATMTGTTGFAAYRVIDGGAQAAATGSVTDKGNGQYSFALSQADTNGNDISILFTMTNMIAVEKTFVTTACDPSVATNFGITSLPTTAVTTNASLLTSGTGTDQISVSAGKILLQATQSGVTIPTVTTVTNQLTAAQIATGVWQDATAGDFTTASSIGKSLYTTGATPGATGGLFIAGTNAATTITTALTTTFTGSLTGSVASVSGAVGSVTGNVGGNVTGSVGSVSGAVGSVTGNIGGNVVGSVASVTGNVGGNVVGSVASVSGAVGSVTGNVGGNVTGSVGSVTGLTTATIATAVWTDTTAGDFTTLSSPGKILVAQLGGAFTTTASSIYSTASLANAPTGGSAPTVSQIATAVWQDATAGDFTVSGSIGKSLFTSGVVPGGSGGLFIAGTNAATTVTTAFTTTFTGNLSGSVASVSGAVGSVTGNVGGNVVGSTASVTAGVTVTTNNDKTGYSLSQAFPTNFSTLSIDSNGFVKLSGTPKKNTALTGFQFYMVLASDHSSPATGVTVTATRSLDGAAFAACANAVTELASGWYKIDLAAADLNANSVALQFTAALCDATTYNILTTP